MSKLKRKQQFASNHGVGVFKTQTIVRMNERNIADLIKRQAEGKARDMEYPVQTLIRNHKATTNKRCYTVAVRDSLIYPLAGLTYREAVNMAYEIAVNPSRMFK